MHSTQLIQVLAVALTTFSVAHASIAGPQAPRIPQFHEIVKRQSGSESSSSASPTRSSSTSSARPTSTSTTSSTTSRETSTAPAPTTPNTPTPTSTTPGPTTPTQSSSAPSTTSQQQNTTPAPSESSVTSRTTYTTVITTTNSDGSISTQTSQIVQETTVPSTNNNDNKGMDEKQRNTIIGAVVGGVGGAIVLAVIGLVAWRIWGRKKNQEEVDNSFGTSAYNVAEKPEPVAGSTNSRTPFQSTLESYHAPTQVNTASNF